MNFGGGGRCRGSVKVGGGRRTINLMRLTLKTGEETGIGEEMDTSGKRGVEVCTGSAGGGRTCSLMNISGASGNKAYSRTLSLMGDGGSCKRQLRFERLADTDSLGRTVVDVSAGFGQLRDPS